MFLRGPDDQPILPPNDRLPAALPPEPLPAGVGDVLVVESAIERRPELRRIRLVREKVEVDRRLADNATLPNLDLTLGVTRSQGNGPYTDIRREETRAGLELRLPLQRNEALGRRQAADAELRRLDQDLNFVRDRIRVEVRDGWSALQAAQEQLGLARRNVELADVLVAAEQTRFRQGAGDLLALQLREQAALEARFADLSSVSDYFLALADYRAATAEELR